MASIAALTWVYYVKYIECDEDNFGRWDLLKEGMMPAFGFFLVSGWCVHLHVWCADARV